jgi:hypothetical protein
MRVFRAATAFSAAVWLVTVLLWNKGALGVRIFVSPDGHDTQNDGSEERPFRSVQAAVDAAWDFDVIVLMDGVHTSDTEIRFQRRKLAVRAQHGPNTRVGGCWPVHTGDVNVPTLTRCNITSWPQKWDAVQSNDDDAWATQATSVQTLPASFEDAGRANLTLHGASKLPIPASEGGDFAEPGDSPRSSPEDTTCGTMGCLLGFHGAGNLQSGIVSRATLVGARFVFLDGDEVILRDLDIRGRPTLNGGIDGGYSAGSHDSSRYEETEGGCFSATDGANVTVVDSAFSFCSASHAGGAAYLGYQANVWFNSVRFLNNSGGMRGGAVQLLMEANVRFTNCEFSGNSASRGAAVAIADGASPVFDKCDFYSNSADKGGGLYLDGDSRCSVRDSAFVHNSALEGGALYATHLARPSLYNSTLQNNSATLVGGAIAIDEEASIALQGCALFFNRAERGGGALVSLAPDPSSFRGPHSSFPVWASASVNDTHFGFNTAAKGAGHVHPLSLAAAVLRSPWQPPDTESSASQADVLANHVCAGRGTAGGGFERQCSCALPYVGETDECAVTCPGYIAPYSASKEADGSQAATPPTQADPLVCSGHGRCLHETAARDRVCRWYGGRRWFCVDTGLARCSCTFGYVGDDCSQQCPGWQPSAPGARGGRQVCSGHGVCAVLNGSAACSCDFGWGGRGCSELRLYVLASGGHSHDVRYNRVVRLGDKVLVNNREQGLHLLALNRSDLTVVWDRNYEVMAFAEASDFYSLGDNDGTVNVHAGRAQDGSTGSHNASTSGILTRNPQVSQVLFREEEANGMARDLSLLDGRHLVVVSSFFAWENQTNPALLQALTRIGAPPELKDFAGKERGQGHALVIVGVPDAGAGNGTYMLGATPNAAAAPPVLASYAEVEVNLALRFEPRDIAWCGARVYKGGMDVSHLEGTACVGASSGGVDTFVDGVDGVVGGGGEEGSLNGASPTWRRDKVAYGSTNHNGDRGMTLRWRVVPRTTVAGHHAGGGKLESWDLSSDMDESSGLTPLLVSNDTIFQSCCNRSLRWDHAGCRRGRSVSSSSRTLGGEQLVCLESGWMTGDGGAWPGLYGNLDLTGAFGHTLNGHSPPWDADGLQARYGTDALYDMKPGHRNTPFTLADTDELHPRRRHDPDVSYDGQGPYGMARSRPTPTTIYKDCDVGHAECDAIRAASPRALMGLAVPHECERGQCDAATGANARQRWQVVPAFTTKAIGQSNPTAGATNRITVTLACNTVLRVGDVVTIWGLTGTQTDPDPNGDIALVDVSGAQFRTIGDIASKGDWVKASGTLTLEVAAILSANTKCRFAFDVTNPTAGQSSPKVQIAASGSVTMVAVEMSKTGTDLMGVTKGSDPLNVAVQNLFAIGQSTPVAGATNTISVTFLSATTLAVGDTVTISGLAGTQTNNKVDLELDGDGKDRFETTDGSGTHDTGNWKIDGTLTLKVRQAVSAKTEYIFSFQVKNPAEEQTEVVVSIEANADNDANDIAKVAMTSAGKTLIGVANGADPLKVVVPAFTTKAIGQSNPTAGATNRITVTLVSVTDLAANDVVTITELKGTQTEDGKIDLVAVSGGNSGHALFETSNDGTSDKGDWVKNDGSLTLKIRQKEGLLANTEYRFAFDVTNQATDNTSPTVNIAATVSSGAHITAGAMTKPGTALMGVANGANPLEVKLQNFFAIGQSTPVASAANNEITVTLIFSVALAEVDRVTISGLTGTQTAGTDMALADASGGRNDHQTFRDVDGKVVSKGDWVQSTGTLTLESVGNLNAGRMLRFKFLVTNPAEAQASPAVSIAATVGAGQVPKVAMRKPGEVHCKTLGTVNEVVLKDGNDEVTVAANSRQADSVAVAQGATAIVLGKGEDGSGTLALALDLIEGDYVRIGIDASNLEFARVAAVDDGADRITVVRQVHPYGETCRPGTPTDNALVAGKKIYKLSGWSVLADHPGVTGGADPLKVVAT